MGVLSIFSTGTYEIIGTTCVESETCYEKYLEKKNIYKSSLAGTVVQTSSKKIKPLWHKEKIGHKLDVL